MIPLSCCDHARFGRVCKRNRHLGRQNSKGEFGCGFLRNVTMNRMKQSVALILALCVIASSASANLGANSEIIEDAYGTIVQRRLLDDGKVSVVYTTGRYLHMVTFANSRSVLESYARA